MNQLQRQGVSIVAVLLVLIGLGALSSQIAQKYPIQTTQITKSRPIAKTVSYQGEDGKTVLELLQRGHTVEMRDSDFGTFVTSIDGTAQSENAFWLYYINGEPATEAADRAITSNGQTIEWRYETF